MNRSDVRLKAAVPARVDLARFAAFGVGLWFVATLAFRLVGQAFFRPDAPGATLAVVLAASAALLALSWALLRRVPDPERPRAALALALPGQLLDVLSTLFFARVFPNLDPAMDGAFGALMLWGYALLMLPALARPRS